MTRWSGGALFMLILVAASEQPTKLDAEMLLELDVLSDDRFGEPDARGRSQDDEWSEFEEPAETNEPDREKRR